MVKISIPNGWQCRPQQLPLWEYMANGGKRAVAIWHRRYGKDSTALNWTACAAHPPEGGDPRGIQKVASYWHLLPTAAQGRKVVWNEKDKYGRRIIDQAFPPEIRARKREDEMRIEFLNGSSWQVVGSDNYNSLVGANPFGVVFSEWPLTDPSSWDYLRPVLRENGGWAIFIFTPRGRNHGWIMAQIAQSNPAWFYQLLTWRDTGHLTEADIQEERDTGMREEMIAQEYECSFSAGVVGVIWGREMEAARAEKRIGHVPFQYGLPVDTYWDIGVRGMAVWMMQRSGWEVRWIDYYFSDKTSLVDTIKELKEKPYIWGDHFGPHDLRTTEIGTGRTRLEIAAELGWHFNIVPNIGVEEGIEVTRVLLSQSFWDEERCVRGLEALENYRREWDDRLKVFRDKPLHDWASHGADAMRMAGVTFRDEPMPHDRPQPRGKPKVVGGMTSRPRAA